MKKTLTAFNTKFPTVIKAVGVLLLLTILVNPLNVLGASTVSGDLPYVVPDFQFVNSAINDSLLQSAYQQLINQNKVQSDDTVLFYVTDLRESLGQYEWNKMYYVCNPVVQTDISGQYNYLTTNMTLGCDYYGQIEFKWNNTFRSIGQTYSSVSILGNSSTIDIAQGSYTPRYPFYLIGDDIKYGDIVVFTNTVNQGSGIVSGSSVAPSFESSGHSGSGVGGSEFLGNGADFGASISQATMPSQPNITNYSWNTYTPPTVDTSTLENLVKSLIDIVKYNATYITEGIQGTLSTIIANIQAYGNYVGSIISYVGRSIITNIQNGIQNLYDNLVSLFEPILNGLMVVGTKLLVILDNIIELGSDNGVFSLTTLLVRIAVPTQEQFNTLVSDSDTFQLINLSNVCYTKIQSEVTILRGLQSSKIIHIPSLSYHGQQIGNFDIDFSWYDNYKLLGDGIISAFLIWNYIWFLFFRLPSYIRGQGGAFANDMVSIPDTDNSVKGKVGF